jgi:hypothetical protein
MWFLIDFLSDFFVMFAKRRSHFYYCKCIKYFSDYVIMQILISFILLIFNIIISIFKRINFLWRIFDIFFKLIG